jgi:hypothetical protein
MGQKILHPKRPHFLDRTVVGAALAGAVAGAVTGAETGFLVGGLIGALDGALDGALVGALVGALIGALVGAFVGALVGGLVGSGKGGNCGSWMMMWKGGLVGGETGAALGGLGCGTPPLPPPCSGQSSQNRRARVECLAPRKEAPRLIESDTTASTEPFAMVSIATITSREIIRYMCVL